MKTREKDDEKSKEAGGGKTRRQSNYTAAEHLLLAVVLSMHTLDDIPSGVFWPNDNFVTAGKSFSNFRNEIVAVRTLHLLKVHYVKNIFP